MLSSPAVRRSHHEQITHPGNPFGLHRHHHFPPLHLRRLHRHRLRQIGQNDEPDNDNESDGYVDISTHEKENLELRIQNEESEQSYPLLLTVNC